MNNGEETPQPTLNEEPNPATTHLKEVGESGFINADNHDLWFWDRLPAGGDVPEVNGRWAGELQDFVPTRGELLVLAEHWTDVALRETFTEWLNAAYCVSTRHWQRVYFAWRRCL